MTDNEKVARVDCHTHLGRYQDSSPQFREDVQRAWGGDYPLDVTAAQLESVLDQVDAAVVLPIDAILAGITIPNELVAEAVASNERLIGFASVDPSRPDAVERADHAFTDLKLRGLKVGPIYQGVHPHDDRFTRLIGAAARHGVPVIWHQGTTFSRVGPLEYARPYLLDRVARQFPDTPMWIAHMGHPWCEETVATIRKHPNLFADVSALTSRPFQLYSALTSANEYRVMDKLLFGSDWPFSDPKATARSLRGINDLAAGTALPRVPVEKIEEILNRDTLAVLGLG